MTDSTPALLLGEAPSRGGDRYYRFPLSGPPARVLCTLAGIPPQEDGSTYGRWTWALYERFECENLFERYQQAEPWSVPRARERAGEVLPELDGRVVVCLGRRVVQAVWGALSARYDLPPSLVPQPHAWALGVRPGQPAALGTIPHPSGLNRALNDPQERERCGETLRRALALAEDLADPTRGIRAPSRSDEQRDPTSGDTSPATADGSGGADVTASAPDPVREARCAGSA